MVQNTRYQTADAVTAILLEAKQVGVYKLTRTALTKYLYLLDYWMAKENNGKTFIGVAWRFHHFGPYSDALAADLDWASSQPAINKVDVSKQDKDFTLYSLSEYAKPKSLETLGVPFDVRQNLTHSIKAFAVDLPGLLNFVYFKTEPMEHAKPGEILSFFGLNKVNFKADIKIIKIPVTDKEKAQKIQSLLLKIGKTWEEDHKPKALNTPPIRDLIFAETSDTDITLADGHEYGAFLTFNDAEKK